MRPFCQPSRGAAPKKRSLAPDVVHIRYDIGEDWSGQWAIFFRVVLNDNAARQRLSSTGTGADMRGFGDRRFEQIYGYSSRPISVDLR